MTTERTDAPPPNLPLAAYRRLERRTSDRVIGGVAGGLADYLNVDPLLIRVGFAGLMLFSGMGLPLYLLGWLFIPASGRQESIAIAGLRGLAQRPLLAVVLGFLALLIFLVSPLRDGIDGVYSYAPRELFWALGIAIVGVLLLLPRGGGVGAGTPSPAIAQPAPGTPPADVATSPTSVPAVPAAVSREPARPASPLGWYALAAVFIGLGLVAIYDTVAPGQVALADYFGTALLVLGGGLIVGTWWGRARILILLGLATLPFALASSLVSVPLSGGIADSYFGPDSVRDVRSEYRLLGGRLYLDLTELVDDQGPVSLTASVAVGDIVVIVPGNADVDVSASAGGGRLSLLGVEQSGTSIQQHVAGDTPAYATKIDLRLDVGIGGVDVERAAGPDLSEDPGG